MVYSAQRIQAQSQTEVFLAEPLGSGNGCPVAVLRFRIAPLRAMLLSLIHVFPPLSFLRQEAGGAKYQDSQCKVSPKRRFHRSSALLGYERLARNISRPAVEIRRIGPSNVCPVVRSADNGEWQLRTALCLMRVGTSYYARDVMGCEHKVLSREFAGDFKRLVG